ncbi:hypothetical protein Tco_0487518, partial [Tanacetum coccineum]
DPRKESECKDQEKEDNVNSTNNVNTASNVNTFGVTAAHVDVNNADTKIVLLMNYKEKLLSRVKADEDEVSTA